MNIIDKYDISKLILKKYSTNKIVNSISEFKENKEEITINQNENNEPIIYIYNSHDTEKYSFIKNDYSVVPTVKTASYILKDYLNDYNIESIVEDKSVNSYLSKHNLSYYYCYDVSRKYIKESMKTHNYKMIIDIHRDSVSYSKTLFKKDNKKYAKVMFVLAAKNKNYKKNESFLKSLNNEINKEYKGLSRGILKRNDVIFNQDLSSKAILIELGGKDNTLEEINNTLEVLAKIISNCFIKEEN